MTAASVPLLSVAKATGQTMWFVSRGTGVVSLILLTVSLLLGILTTVRFETRAWPRFVVGGLHRNVSLLILVFLAIHIATTVLDGFVKIGFLDAVLPFHSPYRTFWLGLGTIAVDLLLALIITSLLRARIGYRIWRLIHWAAYACWPVALVHGIETGSDRHQGWMKVIDLVSVALVVLAGAWRVAMRDRIRPDTIGPPGPMSLLGRER